VLPGAAPLPLLLVWLLFLQSARTPREHKRLQLCRQLLHLLQCIANQQWLRLRCFCHTTLSAALLLLLLLLLGALEWYCSGLLYQLDKSSNCNISLCCCCRKSSSSASNIAYAISSRSRLLLTQLLLLLLTQLLLLLLVVASCWYHPTVASSCCCSEATYCENCTSMRAVAHSMAGSCLTINRKWQDVTF
jgi:hypothetical protein